MVVDGKVLVERTWAASPVPYVQDVASAQKSVTSVLVRLARSQGQLSMGDAVSDHLGDGWSFATTAQERAITVQHLVTMTTGLSAGLRYVAPPGTVWDYNTTTYQLTRLVLEHATGTGIEALTRSWLWDPIGVSSASRWAPRPGAGGFSVDPEGRRLWGLTMTERDMARFGLLVSRHGAWGSRQVVPRAELDGTLVSSQAMNPAYGELWWLNGKDRAILPSGSTPVRGPLVPSAPQDMVAALGAGDQKIYVCPSDRLVVARQGGPGGSSTLGPSSFDEGLWSRLARAMP